MAHWRRASARAEESIEARIERALQSVRPLLHLDEFTVELVEFERETGVAVLRVGGGCSDCDMHAARLGQGIEAHLRTRVTEVREVRIVAAGDGGAGPHT